MERSLNVRLLQGHTKIAIDDDKNRLLVATWDHLDQNPVWERCPHSLLDEDAVDYFVTAHKELSYGGIKIRMKDEFNCNDKISKV